MIKIYLKKQEEAEEWYPKTIIKDLKKKWKKLPVNAFSDEKELKKTLKKEKFFNKEENEEDLNQVLTFLKSEQIQSFLKKIYDLSDEHVTQLVTIAVSDMPDQAADLYASIEDYVLFCHFFSDIFVLSESDDEKKDETILKRLEAEYDNDQIKWLKPCFKALNLSIKSLGTDSKVVVSKINTIVYGLNVVLGKKIDYSYMEDEVRHKLAGLMDVSVCPYCNQAFVYSLSDVEDNGKITYQQYLGDLDHLLPKSVYRLFSLSMWNLIPCCKPCNQLFKRANKKNLLNPLEEGFGDDCKLSLKKDMLTVDEITGFENVKSYDVMWKVNTDADDDKKKLIQNNIEVFHLDEIYKQHQRIIQTALRRRYIYRGALIKEILDEQLKKMNVTDKVELHRFIHGVSGLKKEYQHEIHGKMIDDILKW